MVIETEQDRAQTFDLVKDWFEDSTSGVQVGRLTLVDRPRADH